MKEMETADKFLVFAFLCALASLIYCLVNDQNIGFSLLGIMLTGSMLNERE